MAERGFTLIELLIVIAIISLLLTILMPTLNQAKELARSAVCLSNLRNLGPAYAMYVSEFHGCVMPSCYINPSGPRADHWEHYATLMVNLGYASAPDQAQVPAPVPPDYTLDAVYRRGPSVGGSTFRCPEAGDAEGIHPASVYQPDFTENVWDYWRVTSKATGITVDTFYGMNSSRDTWPDGWENHRDRAFLSQSLPSVQGYNHLFLLSDVPKPGNTPVLFDGAGYHLWPLFESYHEIDPVVGRHFATAGGSKSDATANVNMLSLDGHADSSPRLGIDADPGVRWYPFE
jgi:prepilin-type N-terminal cleavage/methylation domain-containing protein